jgi:hypothetical protein
MDISNAFPGFFLDFFRSVGEIYSEKTNPQQKDMAKNIQKIVKFILNVSLIGTFYWFLKPSHFLESRVTLSRGFKFLACMSLSRSSFWFALGVDMILNPYSRGSGSMSKIINTATKIIGISFILNSHDDGEESVTEGFLHAYSRNVSLWINQRVFPEAKRTPLRV